MQPAKIPVAISATDPLEIQAFETVLQGGAFTPLVLASPDMPAMVTLVCGGDAPVPNGPCVQLGRDIPTPARLMDILNALERAATHTLDTAIILTWAGWALSMQNSTLTNTNNIATALTDIEARFLYILFTAQGESVARDDLLARVWHYRADVETHTVETHVYRLRQKIEDTPNTPRFLLTTETGYRLAHELV